MDRIAEAVNNLADVVRLGFICTQIILSVVTFCAATHIAKAIRKKKGE